MTHSAQLASNDDAAAEQADTNNTRIIPVILVPGVMGSRLQINNRNSPSWDPDSPAQMLLWARAGDRDKRGFLDPGQNGATVMTALPDVARNAVRKDELKLVAAREDPSVVPRPVTGRSNEAGVADQRLLQFFTNRGWGTVVSAFYLGALTHLYRNLNKVEPGRERDAVRFPVYASGYDWRQSNLVSGARLATALTNILARHPLAKRAVFVTHSMGGLVFRSALPQIESRVQGVVHTVIPSDGAVVAYRRFHTGATSPFDAPQSPFPAVAEVLAATVLNAIMGSDPVTYALTQSALQGPVELLPNNNYGGVFLRTADGGTNQSVGDVYATYAREGPPGIVPRPGTVSKGGAVIWTASDSAALRARIAVAQATHATLGQRLHPNTFSVFGDGLRTDTEFDWNLGLVNQVGDEEDLKLKVSQIPLDDDPDNPSIKVSGDGTVPTMSARLPALPAPDPGQGPRRFRVRDAEHAGCFAKTQFVERVEVCVRALLGKK